jgi:hypothetical protein
MKTNTSGKRTGKLLNLVIVALVIAGTLFVSGVGEVATGSSLMVRLFLGFLGAIIAIQIIPCLILFGAIVKGLFDAVRGKGEAHTEAK